MIFPMLTVYSTFPTRREAERVAAVVVKSRLAACANSFPVTSFYTWKGRFRRAGEHAVVFKTTEAKYPRLERAIWRMHSDEVPCIVAWKDDRALREYSSWVARSCA